MRTKEVLARLREARKAATFDSACFSLSGWMSNNQDTALICEITRLYRESWIIGPLDEAIAEIERSVK